MTSTIKVNTVTTESGSTLTLGGCGKTVALASGASQTGFGRTGTVDWQTTKKTATFTAANGEGYFVDTSGGAVTMNLPSSPSAGNIVAVKDYLGTFADNNLTIGRGGSPINGGSGADVTISTNGASIVLVYVDATQGWLATQDDSSTFSGATFISATGGTITTCGNDKIHTFTGPGTFTVSSASSAAANNIVSYLILAGGGGGASWGGGGGGAGGYREIKNPVNVFTASPLDGYGTPGNRITVSAQGYPITVGGGGPGSPSYPARTCRTAGSNSVFSTITAAGGGAGTTDNPDPQGPITNGGSGGGGYVSNAGGTGNTPPVTPPQGNDGGTGVGAPNYVGGGGGGAGGVGGNASQPTGGAGGAGVTSCITASPVARGGGGGGGGQGPTRSPTSAGGGEGGSSLSTSGSSGTANTGGGGGAAGSTSPTGNTAGPAGQGGSGIVVIRYKFQA